VPRPDFHCEDSTQLKKPELFDGMVIQQTGLGMIKEMS
jgi:hypothetical protein